MAVDPEVIDILAKAREDLARPGGWCKGTFMDSSGAHCAAGAIRAAANGHATRCEDTERALRVEDYFLDRGFGAGPRSSGTIFTWNDDSRRTLDEVLGKFDCVIQSGRDEIEAANPKPQAPPPMPAPDPAPAAPVETPIKRSRFWPWSRT